MFVYISSIVIVHHMVSFHLGSVQEFSILYMVSTELRCFRQCNGCIA